MAKHTKDRSAFHYAQQCVVVYAKVHAKVWFW